MNYLKIKNKNKIDKRKKVFIGISGGVDSAVSAFLLKNAKDKNGNYLYDVIAVFIKVWTPDFIECTWQEDRRDAIRICSQLEIPFITLDLEKKYKKDVIDYMIKEYKNGKTPNPDVFCNKEIKFGAFFDWAIKNGADFVATGHYSRISNNTLIKAKDENKDQTYFLWTINKNQLSKIIFPIGNFLKSEVREIAEKNNLIVSKKRDSQGLCFIGKINVKDFLKIYIKEKTGDIILNGKKIGIHNGIMFYTIGEKINGYFIIKKDIKKNILYVSENNNFQNLNNYNDKENEKNKNKIILEKVNFTEKLKIKNKYKIQTRYHGDFFEIEIVKIKENKRDYKNFEFEYKLISERDFIYTSGQSMVFYNEEKLIGGGIMK